MEDARRTAIAAGSGKHGGVPESINMAQPRWITEAEATGDFELLSANITRVDASGDDSTGKVDDLSNPFLTVQAAINAIQALDPIPDWPIIEVGNFDNGAEEVTTSLVTLAIRGSLSRNAFTFTEVVTARPFLLLTFTAVADIDLILENCSSPSGDIVANNGSHKFRIQLLNCYLSAILADGQGEGIGNTDRVIVDGGGNSFVTDIFCLAYCEVYNFTEPINVTCGDGYSVKATNSYISGVNSTPGEQPASELQLFDSFATSSNAAATSIEEQNLLIKPPTSDPLIEGALWNNSGTPTISAGPPP